MNDLPSASTVSVGAYPVTTTNTTLSETATDDGGESNLIYSWSIVSAPSNGGAWFSLNDSNAAKNTTVTFMRRQLYVPNDRYRCRRAYVIRNVNVTVQQTLTAIAVTPGDAAVLRGTTRQFAATAVDQFGNDMTNQPSFTWSVSSGESIRVAITRQRQRAAKLRIRLPPYPAAYRYSERCC